MGLELENPPKGIRRDFGAKSKRQHAKTKRIVGLVSYIAEIFAVVGSSNVGKLGIR